MKIAVYCPNWVGDLVMATPAMRAVRAHYPDAKITGILRPHLTEVLQGLNLVDDWLYHQPRGRLGNVADRGLRFARTLRRRRFDLAVVLPNSFRTAWWAWVSGAKRRVGLARSGRSFLLTDAVPASSLSTPHPVIDEYLKVSQALGSDYTSREMELTTTLADVQRFDQFCDRHPKWLASGEGLVALNPGGAFGASKHWPAASFAAVGRQIATQLGKRVVVLCGPAERDQAREIVRLANHPAVETVAEEIPAPSLGLTKAIVRNADLLVTTDSGPRHFAPPFQVPVITLFGPTHIAWSETYYERSLHLQREVDCGPCQKRVCPLGHHRCMRELNSDLVMKAVITMLERYPATNAA